MSLYYKNLHKFHKTVQKQNTGEVLGINLSCSAVYLRL